MIDFSDVQRRRAERTIREILNDGMARDFTVESALLARTIPCGIKDAGIEWVWDTEWALPRPGSRKVFPSLRQLARNAVEQRVTFDPRWLDPLFQQKVRSTRNRPQEWVDAVDRAIASFLMEDMFGKAKPSDDWPVMFSRAYLVTFSREWEAMSEHEDGVERFQRLGDYIASHIYATASLIGLRRTLKKAGKDENSDLLMDFWQSRIREYDRWLEFAVDSGNEPDYLGAVRLGDIEVFWESIGKIRLMRRLGG